MNFQAADENRAHLNFMLIGQDTRKFLAEFWKIVEPRLGEMLAGFYIHAGTIPALDQLIGGQSSRLQKAQQAHWERLFSGRFDEAYFSGVRSIGLAHNRIGLEPRWYIGAYNFVLVRLTELAVESYRWTPGKLKAVLRALNSAVMLDMELAISVYQEALIADRAARGEKLAALLQGFDGRAALLLGSVAAAGSQLHATAKSMSATATQTREKSASVAAASEEASVNVQTVASSAEELSRSIVEILRHVSQSSDKAHVAVEKARGANETMQQLVENAGKISAVVQLIQDIAAQTNLLALNATIEAARAGEAGKGFAVVANEVKSLANQTAKATQEIAHSVSQIQGATRNADAAILAIGAAIEELSHNAAAIASGVEQQGEATQEIARSVQEAAHGTRDVASNIIGVNQAADETGAAAGEVLDAAATLARHSGQLNVEVKTFIQQAMAV
jgi:methyl-accepting chemotaxis protein